MRPAVIVTWGVALLLAVAIALANVSAYRNRLAKCSRVGDVDRSIAYPKSACAQARTQEDQTLIAGGAGVIVVVMGTVIALILQKPD